MWNPSAVAANDPLYRGQTDPRARELLRPVQSLKGAKQLVCVGHVEASTVVAHIVNSFPIIISHAKFNTRCLPFACIFPGIFKKVCDCDMEQ